MVVLVVVVDKFGVVGEVVEVCWFEWLKRDAEVSHLYMGPGDDPRKGQGNGEEQTNGKPVGHAIWRSTTNSISRPYLNSW
jgi:hypothetical protein